MEIEKIGVIGAGSMGGGIAHLAATKGFEVILTDVDQRFLDAARQRIGAQMDKDIARQKMTAEDKEKVLGKITTTTTIEEFAAVDFVIEAVTEDLELKKDLFKKLDAICRPEVILATNTSSLSVTDIASATSRPERVAGMHFFNPPQVMRLVEVVCGYQTSEDTKREIKELAGKLGKTAVVCQKDTPGFIVNRILFAQFFEAIRILEEGVATPEDIDTAVTLGLNYPMGPFQLMDFGGLDLAVYIGEYFFRETKDMRWNPPHTLKSLVKAGRTGRKAGAGWYNYQK
ncbi:3-hydroxyacyl-CoA dehydrogenase family protein [Moorella sulfitireducens]|uniref:3-hydroxyacyl-CoA dehydrogenase family protein n=1 Tax=Neomoorella sulfitireducens TaxID=2972948 RepID=UPI0021AD1134|nr:3-hydroxyacyl-CoA dehydrogenase family protein [Moorella sulfitireducens]